MKFVLVDTSVWSIALRKKNKNEEQPKIITYLIDLIQEMKTIMIGPIRQELLSGISDIQQYETLRENLSGFPDYDIKMQDYENAAQFYNICRQHGVQGSHTDFLICSVAYGNNFSILTLDKDFDNYKKYLEIELENLNHLLL